MMLGSSAAQASHAVRERRGRQDTRSCVKCPYAYQRYHVLRPVPRHLQPRVRHTSR